MFFYMNDRKPVGPFPSEVLIELCKSGTIKSWTQIRKGEDGKWVTAGDQPKLAGLFKAETASPPATIPVTTIERTAKKWKAIQLVGAIIGLVGVTMFFVGIGNNSGTLLGWGILVSTIGFAFSLYGRLSAWWHHD